MCLAKPEIDERRRVAVAPFGMSRRRRCIPCNENLETLLEQVAQVRLYAHVRQHPTEDDFADTALAQLQCEIVGLRTHILWGLTTTVLPSSI